MSNNVEVWKWVLIIATAAWCTITGGHFELALVLEDGAKCDIFQRQQCLGQIESDHTVLRTNIDNLRQKLVANVNNAGEDVESHLGVIYMVPLSRDSVKRTGVLMD